MLKVHTGCNKFGYYSVDVPIHNDNPLSSNTITSFKSTLSNPARNDTIMVPNLTSSKKNITRVTTLSDPNSVLYSANNNYIKQFPIDSSSFIYSVSPISPVSPASLLPSHFVDENHGNLNTDELLETNKQRKKLNQDLSQDTERWCDTFFFPRIVSQLLPLSF